MYDATTLWSGEEATFKAFLSLKCMLLSPSGQAGKQHYSVVAFIVLVKSYCELDF